jgi:DNA-directed RNA polymerase specialized sigma24 family protein
MPSNSADLERGAVALENRARIKALFDDQAQARALCLAITAMVRAGRTTPRGEQARCVDEVLSETVCRALDRPGTLKPGFPVRNWLIGIARNVLKGQGRERAREARLVRRGADLSDEAWDRVLTVLRAPSPDGLTSLQIDIEQVIGRLSPEEKKVLGCHYRSGLDGEDLATAIGAPTANAAYTRLHRARQRLWNELIRAGWEETR